MPRNDINIYLRAEAREALNQLTERWGVSRQEAIVRALIIAAQAPADALEQWSAQ